MIASNYTAVIRPFHLHSATALLACLLIFQSPGGIRASEKPAPSILLHTSFDDSDQWSFLGLREDNLAMDGRTGDLALKLDQRRVRLPSEPIPIDPNGTYEIRAFFKAVPGSEETRGLLGVTYLDKDGQPIAGFEVHAFPDTQTILTQPSQAGDTEVFLEEVPSAWPDEGNLAIAFDARDDLSDIPNRNSYRIESSEPEGTGLRLHLREPLNTSFPAGTKVRCHGLANHAMAHFEASSHWEAHGVVISGLASPGDPREDLRSQFWPGTVAIQARLGMWDRSDTDQGREILVDDLRIRKLE